MFPGPQVLMGRTETLLSVGRWRRTTHASWLRESFFVRRHGDTFCRAFNLSSPKKKKNLGQHSTASQALRIVFMMMWFQSGMCRAKGKVKPCVPLLQKVEHQCVWKNQRYLSALRHLRPL